VAALAQDDGRLVDEAADLVYHLVVLLRTRGLSLGDVARRLEERHRPNG
jgi:phosphoribosyl-ATP pyrophosphohydrolase/phosphoribosyl-AMP cyclohydrolase